VERKEPWIGTGRNCKSKGKNDSANGLVREGLKKLGKGRKPRGGGGALTVVVGGAEDKGGAT